MKKDISHTISSRYIMLGALGFLILPGITFAVAQPILDLVGFIETVISAMFPIFMAVGILVFGYNIFKYLTSKNQADQNVFKSGIINSLVALFVLFVFFGVIKLLAGSLGITQLGGGIGTSSPEGLANGSGGVSTFRNILLTVSAFISQRVIPIMIGAAILFFMGNTIISMTKGDNEQEREKLNSYLRWGILALFVLFTLFSLVGFLTGSFFGTRPLIPQFETSE